MGNCLISRKPDFSGLNYIRGYNGFSLSQEEAMKDTYIYSDDFKFLTSTNQDLTIEFCFNLDSSTNHIGYFFDSGNGSFIVECSTVQNDVVYLALKCGGNVYRIDYDVASQNKIEIPVDQDITFTIRIGHTQTDIYINGSYADSSTYLNNTMLDNITTNSECYFMNTPSANNRQALGYLYAFRVYNKFLTNSEILHNYNEDVKLINGYRGGGSSGGTGFNYVEGFQGIDSLNPIFSPVRDASNQGIYLENTNLYTRSGQSLTIEICMNLDANRNRSGRYFELNSLDVILSDEYYNNDYYIEVALNGANWYFSRQETQIFEQNITMSLVIGDSDSKIYRNGSLLLADSTITNSMIPDTYNDIDRNDLYIMEGNTSSRYASGKFYAFRFYNKALTASEIAQNYQEDLKLISLVNGS